ncbi:hypothetical protein LY90DRAFT_704791 [Neocallimastix californiae]|jgi:hypothetical protein|uniref:Uncharacterized protein n=1 Tax=Neocallimastix californiae TaxID=1754190 RepID=A0A1Y2BPA0_9FUNG|nr:hypothetical protein LY90DRAFT_704791 [Neocallimastix californiae]|eukprot:ORY36582.1 hypothetical protein LY90DRAFT_704791 [Neocallimastix californiae]
MYQIPYGGGGCPPYQQQPFQQGYSQGGYPPLPPGAFANGGFNPYGNFNSTNNGDDESEYEYITDDDGDYIEDEDGTILTMDEAQNRGLVGPVQPGEGERGIGKKLLIGGVVLGGFWMLRKQLKKKKKVKKPKVNKQTPLNSAYNSPPPQNIYGQPQQGYPSQNIYGQNVFTGAGAQKRDVPGNYGGPGFGGPGFGGLAW